MQTRVGGLYRINGNSHIPEDFAGFKHTLLTDDDCADCSLVTWTVLLTMQLLFRWRMNSVGRTRPAAEVARPAGWAQYAPFAHLHAIVAPVRAAEADACRTAPNMAFGPRMNFFLFLKNSLLFWGHPNDELVAEWGCNRC